MAAFARELCIKAAKEAATHSYSPYSNFKVGAFGVFENEKGEQKGFSGCNVENAAYGPTNCGERSAIFAAVSAGFIYLVEMWVYTPTQEVAAPCGVCRQVMYEFNPEAKVICVCDDPKVVLEKTVAELLPFAFGPKDLGK
ncbi:MAG TPA: cytidine deaminase [Patescibacteria group bacterium]|nr:cytidine deaminase [Patescibacteria group bacterium]